MKKKKISKKKVKQVADLAKINLSDKEVEKFQTQLESIINYFSKLEEVDTSGVEPTSQVTGIIGKMRKDQIKDFLSRKHALQNAPQIKGGHFKTKPAIDN